MVKIYNVSCVCPLHNETQMSIAVLSKVLSIKMVYIRHVHVIALFWIDYIFYELHQSKINYTQNLTKILIFIFC